MAQLSVNLDRPNLKRIIGPAIGGLPNELGRAMVKALMAPQSTVRVRTGTMKASFGFRVDGGAVGLTNATSYGQRVEDKYGDAADTLDAAAPQIIARLGDLLGRRFE